MKTFKKFIFLLSYNDRIKAGLLLIMMLIMALLDMVGVASILPFMAGAQPQDGREDARAGRHRARLLVRQGVCCEDARIRACGV